MKFNIFTKLSILSIFILLFDSASHAQLTVQQQTPTYLLYNVLLGAGVQASNVTWQGAANQFGEFNGANSNIGLNSGIVLTTCQLNPPNGLDQSANLIGAGTPGDQDLSNIVGSVTNNASVLEFDFIPTGDTIKFDYVFASEEYNEYVGSQFNDVFAFLLTGPNPFGPAYNKTNIATIPSTLFPVTINNVNNGYSFGCSTGPCNNCQYFYDNCNPTSVAFDGFTLGLQAIAAVYPCSTYHIKLAVADVVDGALNSAVFFGAGSFTSALVDISSDVDFGGNDTIFYEGCTDANIYFVRTENIGNADTVIIEIGGTATNGVDYTTINDTLIFQSGQDSITINITPFMDSIPESDETIILKSCVFVCNDSICETLVLVIKNVDPLYIDIYGDTLLCYGEFTILYYVDTGGTGNSDITWYWNGGNDSSKYDSLAVFIPTTQQYVLAYRELCYDSTFYDTVEVAIYPVPNLTIKDDSICPGELIYIGIDTTMPGYNFTWTPPLYLADDSAAYTAFAYNGPLDSVYVLTYYLVVDSGDLSCFSDSVFITILPDVEPQTQDTAAICQGSQITIATDSSFYNPVWNTGQNTYSITVTQEGLYTVNIVDSNGCEKVDSFTVLEQSLPTVLLEDQQVCQGDTAVFSVGFINGNTYLWSNGEADTAILASQLGEYWVTITNNCGSATDTAQLTINANLKDLPLPNLFTPNGDGINDTYTLPLLSQAEEFDIRVFNRWGNRIFRSISLNEPWDGTTSTGARASSGVYYIVLDFVNCQGEASTKRQTVQLVAE